MQDVEHDRPEGLVVAALAVLPIAYFHGGLVMPATLGSLGSLAYVALGNSVGATSILYLLLRREYAADATSLLYLVPPMTALIGAAFLNQPLGLTTLAGLAVATAGVLLTKLRSRPVAAPVPAQRTPVRAGR